MVVAAVLSAPIWFASNGRTQPCTYQCSPGAFTGFFSEPESGCGDFPGTTCYHTYCGGICQNKSGQLCSPGQNPPSGCYAGYYEISSCISIMPCGCSYFCSQ